MGSVDKGRHQFTFKIEQMDNGSFVASVVHDATKREPDDVGALYYVVVVIFLYGCSILMMIASYIRKNKMDRKLNRYLKEMANVRKRERQLQLFNAAAKAAAQYGQVSGPDKSDISETETDAEPDASKIRKLSGSPRPFGDNTRKVFLDLPSNAYTTDSDNETSTEGDTAFISYARPQKSILKNSYPKSVKLLLPGENEPSSPTRDYKTSSLESIQDCDAGVLETAIDVDSDTQDSDDKESKTNNGAGSESECSSTTAVTTDVTLQNIDGLQVVSSV